MRLSGLNAPPYGSDLRASLDPLIDEEDAIVGTDCVGSELEGLGATRIVDEGDRAVRQQVDRLGHEVVDPIDPCLVVVG